MTSGYSELALDHAASPRNVGSIPDANGVGVDRNPVCGDLLALYLKVSEGRVIEAKHQTQGCTGATAAASILTELLQGRSVEEAAALTHQSVLDALGGLPPSKLHSAALAVAALRKALADYQRKQ